MRVRSVLVYTVLRLLAFLVPLGLMMLLPIFREMYWFAIGFATLIGLSLSMIFLRGPREQVAAGLQSRRDRAPHHATVEELNEVVEDAANDAARGDTPEAPPR